MLSTRTYVANVARKRHPPVFPLSLSVAIPPQLTNAYIPRN